VVVDLSVGVAHVAEQQGSIQAVQRAHGFYQTPCLIPVG
jgi:hypothetical protein